MYKVIRRIVRREENGKITESVYDKSLDEVRTTLSKLIIAACSAAKITPKQLFSSYNNKKTMQFANDFNKLLNDAAEKVSEELSKQINKK